MVSFFNKSKNPFTKKSKHNNEILPGLKLIRKGDDLDITLEGRWYTVYSKYYKIRRYLSLFYWNTVFPRILKIINNYPLSLIFQNQIRGYEQRKEIVVINKISEVSRKLDNPVLARHIIETEGFIIYPCHIITKRKSNWQKKFEQLLSKELGTDNFFIRPSEYFENTIDIMIPK